MMIREKSKWKTHKGESTEARHRGGATRSSDEAGERPVERRGCVNQRGTEVNLKREEPNGPSKAVQYFQEGGMGSL